ncbi:hypothetical protein VNO77_39080 [Canavalia gladiata]|uniref:Bet v I/Major latex protein domain-containing protein n=1 Tax=Canavalia gladiata TaxID=3824 RepID=A0AAN9PXF9_CANGL
MPLKGKLSTEIGVHATAAKWFSLFASQLDHIQNLAERIHGAKLHQGDDWHSNDSVKHWTYTIDEKVTTCQESIESVDEVHKIIIYNLFGGDIENEFKVFKLIFQAVDKDEGGAAIKWSVEYEKINEDVEPPYGYMGLCNRCVKDIDAYLVKA